MNKKTQEIQEKVLSVLSSEKWFDIIQVSDKLEIKGTKVKKDYVKRILFQLADDKKIEINPDSMGRHTYKLIAWVNSK